MINESSVASVKHLSRALAATVIAFVIVVLAFASTAFAGMVSEYNVTIDDNGNRYTITTDETEPLEILNKANIVLGSNDKLSIADFTEGRGGVIVIDRLNTIHVQLNDIIKAFDVYANTVGDALKEAGIDTQGCIVNYSSDAAVENGMVITVQSTEAVVVNADGESVSVSALKGTVSELLSVCGITLGEKDYTEPSEDTVIENGMEINVFRVEIKTVTENETVEYETIETEDDSLDRGTTEIETEGVNGEKAVTYEITFVNGEEESRNEIASKLIKEPVSEVKKVGTKPVAVAPNGVESANGYYVGQTINGKYTHYCACVKCCGKSNGITSSGKRVQNGMADPYYVACNWLPLGSVIEVNGETYTVVDHGGGGLSKSGRIDIYTPEGHSAAIRKGTGKCTITIVRLGW